MLKISLRKIMMVVLAVIFVMLPFAGCSDGDTLPKLDPKNPVSLEIWHYYNGVQQKAFDKMVQEFNETTGKEKGIVVSAFSQGNVSDLMNKVIDAANKRVGAGDIPDIYAAYADTAYAVDQLGLVASLDQYLTDEQLAKYRAEYLDEGRFDEEESLKIFPVAKSTEIMILNKTDWDKFAAATGAKLDDLSTIEGVTETAQKYYEWTDSLTGAPGDGKAFFGRDALANYMLVGCRQLGVEIFEVQGGKMTLNLDKTVMRKIWDHYYVPIVKGYYGAFGRFRSDDAKTGDIIALVGSTAGAAYFPDAVTVSDTENYDIECIMLPAPNFADSATLDGEFSVQQGAGMVVSKTDAKTEYAATIFLTWFTEASRNIEFSVLSGYLPVTNEANDIEKILPALSGIEDAATKEKMTMVIETALEQISHQKLYTSKAFEGGVAARKVLDSILSDIAQGDRQTVQERMNGGMSLDEAAAEFMTDEYFDTWYAKLENDLNGAIGQ